MLTDSDYAKSHKVKIRAVSAETNRRWSDKQKIECVTMFLSVGGSVALTSAALRIPQQTIFVWKRSQWWNDMVSEIKQEGRLLLSQRLQKIRDKTLGVIEDRIEHGDFIFDQKKGKLVRKPVSMKDAAKVAADTITLSERLEMNDNFTVAADQIEDKLAKLAKAFQDLAKGVVHQPEPEDIEFVEEINAGDLETFDDSGETSMDEASGDYLPGETS